eukprot:CAMPEP_0171534120 /NCGR_PEP_ID=MMETSP0959-20130129/16178_1 /TAXON_ID=87120 /ORGANISM="Aurantiochytrium limacinum, Strain ATCCMYA-1381" /LENGTH=427 /DNA_ID=CAMNT_0012079431 /DNA_START=38 /DNA_END=1322 /DNA_ORIENTATION=+
MSLAPTVVVGDAPNAAPTSRRRLSFDIEATSLTILSQVPNQVSRGVLLLAFVFVFTLFFSIAELFAGLASQSLLLVEESVHMFADSVSFGISLWAEFKSETEHSERANLIGAGISLLTLTITMFAIGIESVRRIFHLHDHAVEVNSGTMLGFGLVLSCFHLFCLALYFCGGISVHSHEQHVNHDCASHNLVLANDKCDSSDEIVHSDECYDDHHELVCTHHHHHFHHEDNCASASEGLRISHIKAEKALGHGRKQNGEHSFTKVPLTSVHLTSNLYDKDTHEVDKEHVHPVHPEACSSHQGCAHGHSHGDGNIEPVSSSSQSSDDDLHATVMAIITTTATATATATAMVVVIVTAIASAMARAMAKTGQTEAHAMITIMKTNIRINTVPMDIPMDILMIMSMVAMPTITKNVRMDTVTRVVGLITLL